jgi:hypothetical protein
VLSGGVTAIVGPTSSLTLDFGEEVGGFVTLHFASTTTPAESVGLTFSESSANVSNTKSDNSNGGSNNEPAITHAATPGGGVSTSEAGWGIQGSLGGTSAAGSQLRGGFRYLTVINAAAGEIDLDGVSVDFTAAPGMTDLRAYPNYFHSNDSLLNRIWYAGAYTVQLDTVLASQGRQWPAPTTGWNNSALIGTAGTSVLVDGAKRDRTVWPGDLGVAVPTDFASLGDVTTVRNSLQVMYDHQRASDGELPYAGPQVSFYGSDAYHMWSLVGTATYFQETGDRAWLDSVWTKYRKAVDFVTAKIGADHLFNGTDNADWARTDAGGKNIELQAICYRVLTAGAALATVESSTDPTAAAIAATWTQAAADLKAAVNTAGTGSSGTGAYWDPSTNLYRDTIAGSGATLYPQDGNSLAVWYGLVPSAVTASAISTALTSRWTAIGAVTPEKSATSIHPFPGSMEVQAHFAANDDQNGLALIRSEWGFMLNAPAGTNSTFWEGYKTDGSSDYSGSYLSMAHGWATGPTSALSFFVLGIDPGSNGGQAYSVIPHPGDLTHVEGRLTLGTGPIDASWDRTASSFSLQVNAQLSAGAAGVVAVPRLGADRVVSIDDTVAWDGTTFLGAPGIASADQDANYIYFRGVQPGSRTLAWGTPASVVAEAPWAPALPLLVTLVGVAAARRRWSRGGARRIDPGRAETTR